VPSVTVGLRACSPARPRHPASLPICVPSVERLPAALSRRLLAETTWRFDYGWRHYPRREPFIPIDQPPAGHTSADFSPPRSGPAKTAGSGLKSPLLSCRNSLNSMPVPPTSPGRGARLKHRTWNIQLPMQARSAPCSTLGVGCSMFFCCWVPVAPEVNPGP